jgi:hypothetical protein
MRSVVFDIVVVLVPFIKNVKIATLGLRALIKLLRIVIEKSIAVMAQFGKEPAGTLLVLPKMLVALQKPFFFIIALYVKNDC